MDINADFFTLFDLPRRYHLEAGELDVRYRDLQAQVHPDRFVAASDAERRLSMQWATQANEAYATLKKPLSRAKYLLHLAGQDLGAENNTAMPVDFLLEQMEWREEVADARSAKDLSALEDIFDRLRHELKGRYDELASLIDGKNDLVLAADRIRRLMFLEKLLSEIDDAIASLEEE